MDAPTSSGWTDASADLARYARVVLRCPTGARLAALITECFERELVVVPLQPRTSDAELADVVVRVGAALVVDGPEFTVRSGAANDHPEVPGLAFVMFTSGSTGRPKGVMLDRAAVLGNSARTAALHGFAPDRPHGTCLPFYHVNALMMSLLGTWQTGAELVIGERFDPVRFFRRLDERGARTASVVPAQLHELLDAKPAWPERLDYLITAASPLPSDIAERFHSAYGPRLRQGYGLSEAVNFSCTMPLLDSADFVDQYVRHQPPVGLPLPGTELRLEDDEVWIRTDDRMRGYWGDPAATAAVVTDDGWLRTGDLGALRDGFLVLAGRRDDVINRGGEKHHPTHIEQGWRAAGLPGRYAALAVPEPELGAEIGLVADDDMAIQDIHALYTGTAPRPAVVQTGAYLTTDTGKPRRRAMASRLAARRDNARRYEELLDYAARSARAIVDHPATPATALSLHLRNQALALTTAHPVSGDPQWSFPRTAAHDCLDALEAYWPILARGNGNGADLMHRHPGLWKRLMTEWPMVRYAEHAAAVLEAGDFLRGRVLEAGSGVGNTTALIADRVAGEFIWSDRVPELVDRGRWPGRGVVLDLDRDPPEEIGRFDTVLATNVLHCTADKLAILARIHRLLTDGGRIVLSEGSSPTTVDGLPWALDHLFSLWDGWWDRGGFRTRWEWLDLLRAAGYRELGFSALRAGRHDLGGVVWGTRTTSHVR